jgi:glycerol uptake facilitator-like aquaporin
MKGSKTFQLKPVAHGWANVIVAELIFTLMLVFVVPSVVTVSSSLSQFFGFAIGMCVAIGGCVMGKISEGSLNPEAYSSGGISMGCFNPAGAKVETDSISHTAVICACEGARVAARIWVRSAGWHKLSWKRAPSAIVPLSARQFAKQKADTIN